VIVAPLQNLIESSLADRSGRNLSGYVRNADDLMSEEKLSALEKAHEGIFAFVLMHPSVDKAVAEYVTAGSLGSDAGDVVFALFTLPSSVATRREVDESALSDWIEIDRGRNPAQEMLRELFKDKPAPPLPGVVLIESFVRHTEPIYVSLAGATTVQEVASICRIVFEVATRAYQKSDRSFATHVGTDLARAGISYVRGGGRSLQEWLVAAAKIAYANASTIVSVVKLFG